MDGYVALRGRGGRGQACIWRPRRDLRPTQMAVGGAQRVDQGGARFPPIQPARPAGPEWNSGIERQADAGASGSPGIPPANQAERGSIQAPVAHPSAPRRPKRPFPGDTDRSPSRVIRRAKNRPTAQALARISHQWSAAAPDTSATTALRLVGHLDVLSSTPAAPFRRAPCPGGVSDASRRQPVRNTG